MKTRIAAFFLCITAAACLGAEQARQPAGSKPLPLGGLTDGLAGALASRPATLVRIGAKELSLESLFAGDLAAAFKCDAAVNAYLDRASENATYEALADAIRQVLEDSLGPFAMVEASAIGDGSLMRFGIALSIAKDVDLPVSIVSADGRLSTAFNLPCEAELEFNGELFVDSGLVNEGKAPRGQALRINGFSLFLNNRRDAPDPGEDAEGADPASAASALAALDKVPLDYGKKRYVLAATELALDASANYRLRRPSGKSPEAAKYASPGNDAAAGEGEEPEDLLSYEDFSAGNYSWESDEYVTLVFSFEETGERPKSERGREACAWSYSYDDLSDHPGRERLVFFDGAESRELEGPAARASKKGKK